MRLIIGLISGVAMSLSPAVTFAQHGPPASGSISPSATTGQPGVECDDGTPPGNARQEHGSSTGLPGSPFVEGDSVSGTHYAGEQPGINDKNTASVSQYDIACFRGPDRP
jgi:hypothetical protein